jgi:hypothetical protein
MLADARNRRKHASEVQPFQPASCVGDALTAVRLLDMREALVGGRLARSTRPAGSFGCLPTLGMNRSRRCRRRRSLPMPRCGPCSKLRRCRGLLRIPDPRGVHQLFSSALSESCSKSACAFPMMSNASEWSPTGIQATRSGRGAFPTRRTRRTASSGSDDSPIIGNGPHRPALPHPVRGSIRSRETNTGPLGAGSHPSHHSAPPRTRRQYSACIPG